MGHCSTQVIPLRSELSISVGAANRPFFDLPAELHLGLALELATHCVINEFAPIAFGNDAIEQPHGGVGQRDVESLVHGLNAYTQQCHTGHPRHRGVFWGKRNICVTRSHLLGSLPSTIERKGATVEGRQNELAGRNPTFLFRCSSDPIIAGGGGPRRSAGVRFPFLTLAI
jgi:hypothetical protein